MPSQELYFVISVPILCIAPVGHYDKRDNIRCFFYSSNLLDTYTLTQDIIVSDR